jgi:hypothetical protein
MFGLSINKMIGVMCLLVVAWVMLASHMIESANDEYSVKKAAFHKECMSEGKLSKFECTKLTKETFYF